MDDLTTAGARCQGEQTLQTLKQLYSEGLLTENCALTPTGIIKRPCVTSLAVDQNSMAMHLTSSDCEGFQKCHISSKWVGLMMICCGMTV